ncbi:MAG: DNA polymerase III subunit beta [Candidatus Cloacimonetes bacterium]|nr:DNA polymerase III subunit beta [Candidatus Cloacimonadota bacterium]
MRFTVELKKLAEHIPHLANLIPVKNTMPILENFLIEAVEGKDIVVFTVSNLYMTVICEFEAKVRESGRIAIPARVFVEMTNSLGDLDNPQMTVSKEEETVNIHCGGNTYQFLSADPSEYPLVPTRTLDNAISVDAMIFNKMVNKTIFSVSLEKTRILFTGVNWKITADTQVMASSDGKRISEIALGSNTDIEKETSHILPIKCLSFMQKIIRDDDLDLQVVFQAARVMFAYANYTVYSNIIEGEYPDYSKVFPTEMTSTLIINNDSFKKALKRLSFLAPDENHKVKIEINKENLKLTTMRPEIGEADILVENFKLEGEDIKISTNARFLRSILDVIDTENVRLDFSGNAKPFIITNTEEPENQKSRYLLMPLRTR